MNGARLLTLSIVAALCVIAGVPLAGAQAPAPSLELVVTDEGGWLVELGHEARLRFTVSNSGETTVTGISVRDTNAGDVGAIALLGPGEQADFFAAWVVDSPGNASGSCVAQGVGPEGEAVSAQAAYAFEVWTGDYFTDYAVSKRALEQRAVPGGVVRYRITVTNADGTPVDADAPRVRVVDDFDAAKAVVLDAGGGSIADGRLVWDVPAPGPDDPPVTIAYSLRVRPEVTGSLVNVVAIENPNDGQSGNDRASVTLLTDLAGDPTDTQGQATGASGRGGTPAVAAASVTGEPFLPFTGADDDARLVWAIFSAACGLVLHVLSRRSATV